MAKITFYLETCLGHRSVCGDMPGEQPGIIPSDRQTLIHASCRAEECHKKNVFSFNRRENVDAELLNAYYADINLYNIDQMIF